MQARAHTHETQTQEHKNFVNSYYNTRRPTILSVFNEKLVLNLAELCKIGRLFSLHCAEKIVYCAVDHVFTATDRKLPSE